VLDDDTASNYPDFAGGAIVSFRPEADVNMCGLTVRYSGAAGSEQALIVGLSGEDALFVLDAAPDTTGDPNVQFFDHNQSFFNPQQLLYVLRNNRVTILINGEIIVDDIEVALPEPDARGRVPDGVAGAILEMSCVMTDAWAYGFRD
jgi:hypothetical protein